MKHYFISFVYFHIIVANKRSGQIGMSSGGPSTSSAPIVSNMPPAVDTKLTVMPNDKFTEADVKEIEAMGFPRPSVLRELRSANGNKTQAMAALFAKSLKF